MIDEPSRHAARLLEALAVTNARLTDLARQLRARREVSDVSHRLESRRYDTGTVLEGYVDAELRQGDALTWWLELQWQSDRWAIEASVLVTHEEGQDTLIELPKRSALTLDDCLVQLNEAASDLVGTLNSVDLAAPVAAR